MFFINIFSRYLIFLVLCGCSDISKKLTSKLDCDIQIEGDHSKLIYNKVNLYTTRNEKNIIKCKYTISKIEPLNLGPHYEENQHTIYFVRFAFKLGNVEKFDYNSIISFTDEIEWHYDNKVTNEIVEKILNISARMLANQYASIDGNNVISEKAELQRNQC